MLKKSCQRIQKVAKNEVYKHNFSTSEIYMYIFFLQKRHKQERKKKRPSSIFILSSTGNN